MDSYNNPATLELDGRAPRPTPAGHNVPAYVALGCGVAAVFLGIAASVAALVCGIIARRQLATTPAQGKEAAKAGLVLGAVFTALYGLCLVFGATMLLWSLQQ